MLSRSLMDSQTVLIKSRLNLTEFNAVTLIPIKSQPQWPGILGHLVLNGTCLYSGPRPSADQTFSFVHVETAKDIFQIVQDAFPQLSYMDFALIDQNLGPTGLLFEKISMADFLAHFHVKMNLDLQDLFQIMRKLPDSAQIAIHEKRWQWGDLQIFLSLKSSSANAMTHLEKLFSLNLSKSDLVQCCELLIECLLQETEINSSIWTNANTKDTLRGLRFPQQIKEKNSQPLLKSVQIRPTRQNDRQGYEFKFFSASPAELSKILQKIQSSEMDWTQ